MASILSVEDLFLTLDGKTILDNVSFSIEEGDFAVLCGRNGAGKSQLLRILKGLRSQSSGRIMMAGEDVSSSKKKRLEKAALVFQSADLQIVGETVEKDVAFGPQNLGLSKTEVAQRTSEALALMELEERRRQRPTTLSGGEKRKLAIAGTLAMRPGIILLDEPFAALDYPSTKLLLKSLIRLHEEGHTILIVSHEIEKFLAHTNRVLILKEGRLIHNGRPEDSLERLREAEVYAPALPLEDYTWLQ